MGTRKTLTNVFGSIAAMGMLAGCVTPSGKSTVSGGHADFDAILNDFNAMGVTIPQYGVDGRVGSELYAVTELSDVTVTGIPGRGGKGIVTSFRLRGAQIEVLNKYGPDNGVGLKLTVHAAEHLDLSKPENVITFEQQLRVLFAKHRKTQNTYIRLNGHMLLPALNYTFHLQDSYSKKVILNLDLGDIRTTFDVDQKCQQLGFLAAVRTQARGFNLSEPQEVKAYLAKLAALVKGQLEGHPCAATFLTALEEGLKDRM
jgi:hypothetical protein